MGHENERGAGIVLKQVGIYYNCASQFDMYLSRNAPLQVIH